MGYAGKITVDPKLKEVKIVLTVNYPAERLFHKAGKKLSERNLILIKRI